MALGRAVLVAAVLVAALAAPADGLTVTTQNVRYTLPPDRARHDIRQAAQWSGVVFSQEMRYRRAAQFAPAGWGTRQASRPRVNNRGDCATFWNRARWRVVRAFPYQFTFAPFRNGHRWALVTVLESRARHIRVATVNVHSVTLSLARRAVFARGIDRLASLVARLRDRYGAVVIGGDWNRVSDQRATLPGMASVSPARPTGSHGGIIDYLYWSRPPLGFESVRVIGHTFSDHNGARYRLHLGG